MPGTDTGRELHAEKAVIGGSSAFIDPYFY